MEIKDIITDLNIISIERDSLSLKDKKDYIKDLEKGIEDLKIEVKYFASNRNYCPNKLWESLQYLNNTINRLEVVKLI